MVDLRPTIQAKSDQWNGIDFLDNPRTITITKVLATGSDEQPTSIRFDGDEGKAYKPCLSMRRILVYAWGHEGDDYVGKQLTLYFDPNVVYGKEKEGGIRISHMSDISDNGISVMLPVRRGKKAKYTVQAIKAPIKPSTNAKAAEEPQEDAAARWATTFSTTVGRCENPQAINVIVRSKRAKLDEMKAARPELYEKVMADVAAAEAKFGAKLPETDEDNF